jgi:hypothetical protein
VELYLWSSSTHSWRGAQLKHRDNFTFTFKIPVFTIKYNIKYYDTMMFKNLILFTLAYMFLLLLTSSGVPIFKASCVGMTHTHTYTHTHTHTEFLQHY